MIKRIYLMTAMLAVTLLSSCEVVGGIFKAGAYTGIIAVVVIIAVILWILSAFRRKS